MKAFDKIYLTTKEASKRYGMPSRWFVRRRIQQKEPNFVQFEINGTVLYPEEETDKWFKKILKMK